MKKSSLFIFKAMMASLLMLMLPKTATAAIVYHKAAELNFEQFAKDGLATSMSSTPYSHSTGTWRAFYVGDKIGTNDISRLAFRADGERNWWLRNNNNTEYGLFANGGTNKPSYLAFLGLKAGDYIVINYTGEIQYAGEIDDNVHAIMGNNTSDLYGTNTTITAGSSTTIEITSEGDLVLKNVGGWTFIKSIKIYEITDGAYKITTDNIHTSSLEFTKDGLISFHDVTVPYMKVSFGNATDYVIVDNLQSHIYNYSKKEDLGLDGNNLPLSGNVYTFNPTANGSITVEGTLNGVVHVFECNNGNYTWTNGQPYFQDITSSTATFPVKAGFTYFLCEDNRSDAAHGSYNLHKFTFNNSFYLDRLGVILENGVTGNQKVAIMTGATTIESFNIKRVSDYIDDSNLDVSYLPTGDGKGDLYLNNIAYKEGSPDKAGTIILDIQTDAGDATLVVTIPYSAKIGRVWNFSNTKLNTTTTRNSDGILEIGQYKDPTSQLREETDNREWYFTKRVVGSNGGFHDPMYQNVFDMVGDNADMIWETEGLWFDTQSLKSCLYNESDAEIVNHKNPDRYVGLLPDESTSFTIPGLKPGDRVEIFMGAGEASGTNACFFHIEGAKDAEGTPIISTDDYNIGGSLWDYDYSLQNSGHPVHDVYVGAYQFIKDETVDVNGYGSITFHMFGGTLAKLYTIKIYTGIKSGTNDLSGQSRTLSNTEGTTTPAEFTINLQNRGKGERVGTPRILKKEGNITNIVVDNNNIVTNENPKASGVSTVYYVSKVGDFGVFRMRVPCMEYNGKYVTDYADMNAQVGYQKALTYPYTWDFTDIKGWSNDLLEGEVAKYSDDYGMDLNALENDEVQEGDPSIFSLRLCGKDKINPEFIVWPFGGTQLYANNTIIPETEGLWFRFDNADVLYNGSFKIEKDGIRLANASEEQGSVGTPENPLRRGWWNCKLTIPNVPAEAAVYARVARVEEVKDEIITYRPYSQSQSSNVNATETFLYRKYQFQSMTEKYDIGAEGDANSTYYQATDGTGDYIIAIYNSGDTQNLTLTLNGYLLKKLSVSVDPKYVGPTGFATESRTRRIDHRLTPYLSGLPVRAYIVPSATAGTETKDGTINIVEADGVLAAYQGCFLCKGIEDPYKENQDRSVKILHDEMHLFVPDMHDTKDIEGDNMMVENVVGNKIMQPNDDNLYYALSNKKILKDEEGAETQWGRVNFYRISSKGATFPKNSSYLSVPKIVGAKTMAFNIKLKPEEDMVSEGFDGDVTPINNIEEVNAITGDWYNLSGQKLNGCPTKSGIYMINGKKIVIK
jgi:hypothetical protein